MLFLQVFLGLALGFPAWALEIHDPPPAACPSALTADSIEAEILHGFRRIQILRYDPARAIHAEELHKMSTVMLDLHKWILPRATSMGFPIRSINMLRKIIDQLNRKLNIFTPREELREIFECTFRRLNGFMFEMLAANRLRAFHPIVGSTTRGAYLGHQLTPFEGAKELDIVIRGEPADVWIEVKFVSAATLTSALAQPSIGVLREHMEAQFQNMARIRDKVDSRIPLALIVSDHLDREIEKVARGLGFRISLLKVPTFKGEDLFVHDLEDF